jgi:hypothetical protein
MTRLLVAAVGGVLAACAGSNQTAHVGQLNREVRSLTPTHTAKWPQYRTEPHSGFPNANGSLVRVEADGAITVMVEMDHGKAAGSRAPGFEASPLRTAVDEVDTGLFYVDILMAGFDLDQNGLADSVVGISGSGNSCEFVGSYYVVFALDDGKSVSSEPFGGCLVFETAVQTSAGLEVRFLEGEVISIPAPKLSAHR